MFPLTAIGPVNPDLATRQDQWGSNVSPTSAYYVRCHFSQCRFSTIPYSTTSANPEFQDCEFVESNFQYLASERPDLHFFGSNDFNQVYFEDFLRVILHGSKNTFVNSKNVRIYFTPFDNKDYTIVSDCSDIDFSHLTKEDVDAVNVKLYVTNGTLILPDVEIPATWEIVATNAHIIVTSLDGHVNGLRASNCIIESPNNLWFRRVENCTLRFTGSTTTTITLFGMILSGNTIETDRQKPSVTFAAEIVTNNYVNAIYNNQSVAMIKGGDCKVCSGNSNGITVL